MHTHQCFFFYMQDSRDSAVSSSFSDSVYERNEMAPGTRCDHSLLQYKNQKRDDKMNSDGLMADRHVCLDFTVNLLKDKELHASAHSSRESHPEHPSKVATKSRKHSNGTHFLSDRNCTFWLSQNHKGFLQNTHWRSSTSCRKVQ